MRTGIFKKALAIVLCASLLNCGDLITIVRAGTLATDGLEAIEETTPALSNTVSGGDAENIELGEKETDSVDTTEPAPEAVITRYDYQSDEVNVLVTLTNPADLPDEAELVVTPVTLSAEAEEKLEEEAVAESRAIEAMTAYDISFFVGEEEVQPGASVNVSLSLPEINAGECASVYHVDAENQIENMDGVVDGEGNVVFDTTHFSTYVIVQSGDKAVNVVVKHLDEKGNAIYRDDVKTLPVYGSINNYAKALNWDVTKVVVGGKELTAPEAYERIEVSQDTEIVVYYKPKQASFVGGVKVYDYTVGVTGYRNAGTDRKPDWVADQKYSINQPKYYADNSGEGNRLTVGKNENNLNYYPHPCMINGVDANKYTGGSSVVKGLLKGLVNNQPDFAFPDPGFFKDEDAYVDINVKVVSGRNTTYPLERVYLRKFYTDYTLDFEQIGDSYSLKNVINGEGTASHAGQDFFPLEDKTIYEEIDQGTADKGENCYFGMRYDINFQVGDYVGPMNYHFKGDDDLWVVLDDTKVVIDLGGIHQAADGYVDLWQYLSPDGSKNLTTEEKQKVHKLTVLYMDRGGGDSNCTMEFTLPSASLVSVTEVPTAKLQLQKVNMQDEALADAQFRLTSIESGKAYVATSAEDGMVVFENLLEGTYTLTEDAAPNGYIAAVKDWVVKVVKEGKGLVALLYEGDGKTECEKNAYGYKVVNMTAQEWIDSAIEYDKTSKLLDQEERTYQIDIEATSVMTNTSIEMVEANADIMMVFDVSGSMLFTLPADSKTHAAMNSVGQYNSAYAKLNPNKIYYLGNEMVAQIYKDKDGKTHDYNNPKCPMIYQNDTNTWIYYDYNNKRWTPVQPTETRRVYTWDSRLNALQEAAIAFVNSMAGSSQESQIGISTFEYEGKLVQTLCNAQQNKNDIIKNICLMQALAGTSPQEGLELAKTELENGRENVPKYVILFTDGAPSDKDNFENKDDTGLTNIVSDTIRKAGVTIYTVGCSLTDVTNKWLAEKVATPGCALTAKDATELKEIFKRIQQSISQDVTISGAYVKDVIDSRFEIVDSAGNPITEAGTVLDNGGVVKYDEEADCWYVEWTDQTIPSKKDGSWKETIIVKAKDDFIGGNNIETNVWPDSHIGTGYGDLILNQPKVNVDVKLDVENMLDVIFWGENVSVDEELQQKMISTRDANALKNMTFQWYEDAAHTKEITLDAISEKLLDEDTEFYLKVSYDAGESTEESKANSNGFVAGGEDHIVDAFGTYIVKVVKGQLQIEKTIDKSYTDIEAINADQTFIYKIERREKKDGEAVETFYEVLSFDANNGETNEVSKLITGLKKGYYTVTEETAWSSKYTLETESDNYDGNGAKAEENRNLFIGDRMPATGDKPEFYGLQQKPDYLAVASGKGATAGFENHIKATWKFLSDVAAAVNKFCGK